MTKVLHVRSSAAGEASVSTKLGNQLIARIPNATVTVRDVGKTPPTIINQVWSCYAHSNYRESYINELDFFHRCL